LDVLVSVVVFPEIHGHDRPVRENAIVEPSGDLGGLERVRPAAVSRRTRPSGA
jgi:hypothetical protein